MKRANYEVKKWCKESSQRVNMIGIISIIGITNRTNATTKIQSGSVLVVIEDEIIQQVVDPVERSDRKPLVKACPLVFRLLAWTHPTPPLPSHRCFSLSFIYLSILPFLNLIASSVFYHRVRAKHRGRKVFRHDSLVPQPSSRLV